LEALLQVFLVHAHPTTYFFAFQTGAVVGDGLVFFVNGFYNNCWWFALFHWEHGNSSGAILLGVDMAERCKKARLVVPLKVNVFGSLL
jgi:hypothetical protein